MAVNPLEEVAIRYKKIKIFDVSIILLMKLTIILLLMVKKWKLFIIMGMMLLVSKAKH